MNVPKKISDWAENLYVRLPKQKGYDSFMIYSISWNVYGDEIVLIAAQLLGHNK